MEKLELKNSKHRIIVDEDEEIIEVGWSCYKTYFTNYYGGFWFFMLIMVFQGMYLVCQISNQYVLGHWSQS